MVGDEDPRTPLAFVWKEQTSIVKIQASSSELTWNVLVAAMGALDSWLRENYYQNCHFTILDGVTEIAEGVLRKRYPFE